MPVAASAQAQATTEAAADLILTAAEAVFAENGFHGATTRAIAAAAGVNPALIHYYFGSKDGLFETVVERRAAEINRRRRAWLSELPEEPPLEPLLEAFLRPTIELGRDAGHGGPNYARLVVQVAAGTDERSRRLTGQNYNAIAAEFIARMQAAVPGLTRPAAVQGYLFAVSIALSLMGRTGRASDLSDGAISDDDTEAVIGSAVTFAAAGVRALASGGPRPPADASQGPAGAAPTEGRGEPR
jgi:AcrR family transcriptional regulator